MPWELCSERAVAEVAKGDRTKEVQDRPSFWAKSKHKKPLNKWLLTINETSQNEKQKPKNISLSPNFSYQCCSFFWNFITHPGLNTLYWVVTVEVLDFLLIRENVLNFFRNILDNLLKRLWFKFFQRLTQTQVWWMPTNTWLPWLTQSCSYSGCTKSAKAKAVALCMMKSTVCWVIRLRS